MNEISFNAALIGELRAIAFVQRLLDDGMLKEPMLKKYRRLNIHAITISVISVHVCAVSCFSPQARKKRSIDISAPR